MKKLLLLVLSGSFLCACLAIADDQAQEKRNQEVTQYWQKFQSSTKEVMDQQLQSWLSPTKDSKISADQVVQSKFLQLNKETQKLERLYDLGLKKTKEREKKFPDIKVGEQTKAVEDEKNKAESIVDNLKAVGKDGYVDTLVEMAESHLTQASLDDFADTKGVNIPWSDDYWAIYRGILGARYASPDFSQRFKTWTFYRDNVENYSAFSILNGGKPGTGITELSTDQLSPSEKYDLITNTITEHSNAGALTKQMWLETAGSVGDNGQVETWMGICHGWSPAAYMVARPLKAVDVEVGHGKTLTFFPADIKALASLLYARSDFPTKFVGRRCNLKDSDLQKFKDANGRIRGHNECFDIYPSTWHKTVVNQIALAKRSFVMDATFDYEVWNQPVVAYSYSYFNPMTGDSFAANNKDALKEGKAKVSYKTFMSKDKFKDARLEDTRSKAIDSVVGVAMDVTYVVEVQPTHQTEDSVSFDGRRTVRYVYDLELDAKGKIIGGEWYTNTHPDFLWTPELGTEIRTAEGNLTWDGHSPLNATWTTKATAEARFSNNARPLFNIVDALVKRSRGEL
ncbi:MAG: hypothetical protein HY072_04020 [Deltaproteobacteria bacterium]|nr:hypothetical protein [Deltaproteobacteria bacterium]